MKDPEEAKEAKGTRAKTRPLTESQAEVLLFIFDFAVEHLYQPPYREVMDRFDWSSTNSLSTVLVALERKGFVERVANNKRAIRFTKKAIGFFRSKRPDAAPILSRYLHE